MASCVQCGKELRSVAADDQPDKCVECQVRERIEREREYKASLPSTWQIAQMFPITTSVVAINLLVFVLCAADSLKTGVGSPMDFSPTRLLSWGANYGPLTLDHQFWRIFTSMFVHGGLIHVGANMWCLWDIGRLAERVYGRWRFLTLYLITGLASGVASLAVHPYTPSVGASGAIFGVVGALVFPFYRKRVVLPPPVLKGIMRSLLIFIVINLLIGAAVPIIDNAAHVGGLVMGLLLGAVVTQLAVQRYDLAKFFPRIAAVSLIAIGAAFVGVQHLYANRIVTAQAYLALSQGDMNTAVQRAKQAIANDPRNVDARAILAQSYYQNKQYADAAREYQAAYAINPQDAKLAGQLGGAYLAIGKLNEAEPLLRQALQADPNDSINLTNLGVTLAGLDRYDEALPLLQKAVASNPKSAKAQYALGAVLMDKHQYEQALDPLKQAASLDSDNADYKKTLDEVSALLANR